MASIVLVFLAASLVLYVVFAGADFGAGILELFKGSKLRREQEDLITHALGPVWEANHVWMVLAVVILFNGFPGAFVPIVVGLHIPLALMLLGITLRGCAFTFRHYDAGPVRPQSADVVRGYLSQAFAVSSVLTPLTLGFVAAGATSGRLLRDVKDASFYEAFIAPWFNAYGWALGVFCAALFAYTASVFLCEETDDPVLLGMFRVRARIANVIAVVAGLCVFPAAHAVGLSLLEQFLAHPISCVSMFLATALLLPQHLGFMRGGEWGGRRFNILARVCAATQVGLVLMGWFALQFPHLLIFADGSALSYVEAAAPPATLLPLVIALIFGSAIIFPGIIYLFRVFKSRAV